jgi:hypothetical protein
MTQQ